VTEGSLIGTNRNEPRGDVVTEPDSTETAADNDIEQTEQGAPAEGDAQETAVDAFVAGDEEDAPAGEGGAESSENDQ
jgi:hypothetical protein